MATLPMNLSDPKQDRLLQFLRLESSFTSRGRLKMESSFRNQQVSAAADTPAQGSDSCPPCCTQMSTVNVINWWSRPVFATLAVHPSWQHLRRSAVPEIWLVPTKI